MNHTVLQDHQQLGGLEGLQVSQHLFEVPETLECARQMRKTFGDCRNAWPLQPLSHEAFPAFNDGELFARFVNMLLASLTDNNVPHGKELEVVRRLSELAVGLLPNIASVEVIEAEIMRVEETLEALDEEFSDRKPIVEEFFLTPTRARLAMIREAPSG